MKKTTSDQHEAVWFGIFVGFALTAFFFVALGISYSAGEGEGYRNGRRVRAIEDCQGRAP